MSIVHQFYDLLCCRHWHLSQEPAVDCRGDWGFQISSSFLFFFSTHKRERIEHTDDDDLVNFPESLVSPLLLRCQFSFHSFEAAAANSTVAEDVSIHDIKDFKKCFVSRLLSGSSPRSSRRVVKVGKEEIDVRWWWWHECIVYRIDWILLNVPRLFNQLAIGKFDANTTILSLVRLQMSSRF